MSGLLVSGARGVGKTSLCHAVCYAAASWPHLAHITRVECKPLRGKKIFTDAHCLLFDKILP